MILLITLFIILPFGFVLLFGAPYLPTRKVQARQALDLLDLKKGDVFVDLGCGDGAVIIEAAKRGLVCYGYELNPYVWFVAKLRTLRFGSQVHVKCRNFWNVPLPKKTKGVFVFLLDKYMTQLDEKLTGELQKSGRLVSYTFEIPEKKAIKKEKAMFLYRY